ncbi:MAG TPA: hypothetical protein VEI01_05490 [Terriglobales bacterium]|nr:hypothetical protein [Terriglobales bacterium]
MPTTPTDKTNQEELIQSARRVWPHLRAHVNRELGSRQNDPENVTLAAEIWEGMLQSIARSLHRLRTSYAEIANLDSYLIGAFRHRFARIRRRQQRRERLIQLVASANELDVLAAKRGLRACVDLEREILAKEVLARMDVWLRRVWTARQYGYSWKEIAEYLGTGEQSTKMKFRYKLGILRGRLSK